MTIRIKIINEDTNTTRSVQVDTSENGATAPTVLIPAGGEETFIIHNTKQLTISELQHPAAETEQENGSVAPAASTSEPITEPAATPAA